MPTPDDLADLLGRPVSEDQALAALSVVTAMARSYCRASWADDELPEDVAAVVKTATLRILAHPEQLNMSQTMGGFAVDFRGGFTGWTLAERFCLDRFRVKAV